MSAQVQLGELGQFVEVPGHGGHRREVGSDVRVRDLFSRGEAARQGDAVVGGLGRVFRNVGRDFARLSLSEGQISHVELRAPAHH